MEASVGVLQELAKREHALSGKVQAARDQAVVLIADAETRAKAILAKADADARSLEDEYRSKREGEEKSILELSLEGAKSAAQAVQASAQSKVSDAVRLVVSKVLP